MRQKGRKANEECVRERVTTGAIGSLHKDCGCMGRSRALFTGCPLTQGLGINFLAFLPWLPVQPLRGSGIACWWPTDQDDGTHLRYELITCPAEQKRAWQAPLLDLFCFQIHMLSSFPPRSFVLPPLISIGISESWLSNYQLRVPWVSICVVETTVVPDVTQLKSVWEAGHLK